MGFFKRRRVRKFAEKAVEQQNTMFVFGSNIFTEAFIDQLIQIGAQTRVALISDKKLNWIEEVKDEVNVLYEEQNEEYAKRHLYETIGFHNAEKVIILHEDPLIIQNIMSFISNEELKVILLAQFAPPFVQYLAGQKQGQIIIVDNLNQIVNELYQQMSLPLVKPPVISIPVPESRISKPIDDLQIPKVRVLNILREDSKDKIIPLDQPTQENDRILLYLEDPEESLKHLVDFLSQYQS
ncbi:MAG: hypothetical protein JSV04_09635 [Candidatus Heimdallarchaeota archaeon]|nr:MAG: hypothetical protein JSV04_09635 [Candidatus Heimdallarchaeota archaeon]